MHTGSRLRNCSMLLPRAHWIERRPKEVLGLGCRPLLCSETRKIQTGSPRCNQSPLMLNQRGCFSKSSASYNFSRHPYRWYLAVLQEHLTAPGAQRMFTVQTLLEDNGFRVRLREAGLRTDPFFVQCLVSVSLDVLEDAGLLIFLGSNTYAVASLNFNASKYSPLLSIVEEDLSDKISSGILA